MSLTINGKITAINAVEKGTSKAGKEWQKQNFVINTGDKFNPEVCFQVFGAEKCENLTKYNNVGDDVEVSFNVSSREYNGKWYNSLDCWKCFKVDANAPAPQPQTEDGQDLPF